MNTRLLALQTLLSVVAQGKSLDQALEASGGKVSQSDQALLHELCFGVCRWYWRLQAISTKLLKHPLKQKDLDVQLLIILGLYQLLFMRIPPHAAVNETVKLCKLLNKQWARALINALLRRFQREQPMLVQELSRQPDYLYAHPPWLLKMLQQAWPDQWQMICKANNERAPMCLRVNQQKLSRQQYLHNLEKEKISVQECDFSRFGLRLKTPTSVGLLPGFSSGLISVQDEAAQLAAPLLHLEKGQRVLDSCAAPGGKTCHILESEPGLIELVALDKNEQRLERIKENLQRLTLDAQVLAGDAKDTDAWWDGKPFDRILIDAPCSGSGVVRRHPDIKLLRRPTDIDKLASQQLQILSALWPLLREGGLLLYATCSILPMENDGVIERFLQQEPTASSLIIEADWGIGTIYGRYLLPEVEGSDGFFYARLIKRSRQAHQ